ncbi:hypothetical protein ON010_g13443 [Phytophthora cinnamomi]|nr:hypothetical protein ON010_g13443 [Phytophthora cinnamomi]
MEAQYKYGERLIAVPWFNAEELAPLREIHKHTLCYLHIHDAFIPITSRGNLFVGLPNSLYSEEQVCKLKEFAVKTKIVSAPAEFEVQNGDEFPARHEDTEEVS